MLTRMFVIALLVTGLSSAQNAPAKGAAVPNAETKYFHLDFVIKDLEGGKTVNARNYSMTVSTSKDRTSIRSGNKLPVLAGPRSANSSSDAAYTYVDVGTNIDCWNAEEVQGELALMVTAAVSIAADGPDGSAPVIRQVKWNSPVIVPIRKPTVIFSSDDPSSKRQMELELTAVPIK